MTLDAVITNNSNKRHMSGAGAATLDLQRVAGRRDIFPFPDRHFNVCNFHLAAPSPDTSGFSDSIASDRGVHRKVRTLKLFPAHFAFEANLKVPATFVYRKLKPELRMAIRARGNVVRTKIIVDETDNAFCKVELLATPPRLELPDTASRTCEGGILNRTFSPVPVPLLTFWRLLPCARQALRNGCRCDHAPLT